MKDLNDLYKKEVPVSAPAPVQAASAEPASTAPTMPNLETPPGLPQEYIDINLKNQPLPPVLDPAQMSLEEKPKNVRLIQGKDLMCNMTSIPYSPGFEPKVVTERVEQGPRVFISRAAKDRFEKGLDEEPETKLQAKKIAHPDTLRPGTFITGDSPAYRPG